MLSSRSEVGASRLAEQHPGCGQGPRSDSLVPTAVARMSPDRARAGVGRRGFVAGQAKAVADWPGRKDGVGEGRFDVQEAVV